MTLDRPPPAWEAPGLSRVERVASFLETLPVTAGLRAGERFRVRPWQRKILDKLYATDDDGRRLVRQALLSLPRKNGKTGLAAGLALAHFVGPEAEPRGQVYSAAADRAQAGLLFQEMKAIVERVPELAERVIVRDFDKSMEDTRTGSTYRALSADVGTKHGLNASFVVYDELAQAPNRNLFDVLATSMAARAEPLLLVISTQSPDPEHVMSELVSYAEKVAEGLVDDPTFAGIVYAAPLDADPWDEATWHACNPALGDFRSLDEMRTAALQAQRIPARESAFRALYLNQPVERDDRFIAAADWLACGDEIDPAELHGRPCFAGLDLSSHRDLSALVLFFPEDGGAVLPFAWVPQDRLDQREEADRVPFRTWHRAGHLEVSRGRTIDRRLIATKLGEVADTFDLKAVAFDRWGMSELRRVLADEGLDALPLQEFGQGFKDMAPALQELERRILERELRHPNNPVLTWCLSNVVIDQDPAGNRKMNKARARERIDVAVALAMAVGAAARQPVEVKPRFVVPPSLWV